MNSKQAYSLVMALPEVSVKDHFGSDGFSANKRIFMTLWHEKNKVNLRLSPEEQQKFLAVDGESFVQIDNAWGRQGWTAVNLNFVERTDFQNALISAWKYSQIKNQKSQPAKKKVGKKKLAKRKSK